jgi:hypothetical protein
MYVSYGEYTGFGFSAVLENEFNRYETRAAKAADKYCFNRLSAETLTEDNKKGICEITELFYFEDNPQLNKTNKIVSSFNNNGYSENYKIQSAKSTEVGVEGRIRDLMRLFFTKEQLYRGVYYV